MNKTTTFIAPAQYVSPVCKTIMLNAEAHYLQSTSPYGSLGSAGNVFNGDNTNDYTEEYL